MSDVVDLDEHRGPWSNWWTVCLDCGAVAVATIPKGAPNFIQCHVCDKMRSVRTAPAGEP